MGNWDLAPGLTYSASSDSYRDQGPHRERRGRASITGNSLTPTPAAELGSAAALLSLCASLVGLAWHTMGTSTKDPYELGPVAAATLP